MENQFKPEITENEDYVLFNFIGPHGEITAMFPKSESRKEYEKSLKSQVKKQTVPPLDLDLDFIVPECDDVNYAGIRLTAEDKQRVTHLLEEIFHERVSENIRKNLIDREMKGISSIQKNN